ncbi:MAG: hypothetical protein ACOYVF_14265 [Candidatus Zixiibacteriota bacterium]
MNYYFVSAAGLIYLLGLVHSLLGERTIFYRLFGMRVPDLRGSELYFKRTLRFAWHATTCFLWTLATVLVYWSDRSLDTAVTDATQIFGFGFFGAALLSLVVTRGRHFSWVLFLAVAILLWSGS